MIRITLSLLFVYSIFASGFTYSAGNTDTSFSFQYYNFDVSISSSGSEFFRGRLNVSENGKVQFSMDSSFTDYVEHKFIDLNGDGSNEMLLYLTEGASPYVFHYLYIFDRTKSARPLFMLQNGEVDTTVPGQPLLSVNARMSPAVLGLWYSWFLKYEGGKMKYIKPGDSRSSLLGPDFVSIKGNLEELKKENQICDDFAYNVFFEYVFITSKLSGRESEAERFFEENYKCENRNAALKQFKSTAADTYSWIKEEENYIYTEY